MNQEKKVGVLTPWVSYYNKLRMLFERDPEIEMSYDNDSRTVYMRVDNQTKADAIAKLIPAEVEFGNIVLKITIIPSNRDMKPESLLRTAFQGNPVLNDVVTIDGVFTNPVVYMVFAKEVAQYFNDNLGDPHGNESTLYQNLAEDVLKHMDGVFYCTDTQ